MPVSTRNSNRGLTPVWVGLTVLAVAAPLMVGSVHGWAQAVLGVGSGVLLMLLGRARRAQGKRVAPGGLPWVVAAGAGYSVMQAVPLPLPLLRVLSPRAAELYEVMADGGPPGFGAISGAPLSTLTTAAGLFTVACVLAVCLDLGRSEVHREFLLRVAALSGGVVLVAGVVHVALGLYGPYGVFPFPAQVPLRTTFINANHAAAALCLGGFAALGLAMAADQVVHTWTLSLLALLCGGGILLSGSHAGVMAAGLGLCCTLALVLRSVRLARQHAGQVVGLRRGSRSVAILALVVMLPALVFVAEGPDFLGLRHAARQALGLKLESIRQGVSVIPEYWLTGMGRGAFAEVFPRHKTSVRAYTFVSPENLEVLLAVEWGVVASLLYGLGWLWAAVRWVRRGHGGGGAAAMGGLAALWAHNQADFNLEVLGVAVPFSVLCGAARTTPAEPDQLDVAQRQALASRTAQRALWAGAVCALLLPVFPLLSLSRRVEPSRRDALSQPPEHRVEALTAHLRAHPTDYLAALSVARNLPGRTADELTARLRWVNRALFLAPTYAETHADAGRTLWSLGRRQQSVLHFAQAQRCTPTWPEPPFLYELVQRGLSVEELWMVFAAHGRRWVCDQLEAWQRPGMAEACLVELVASEPGNASAWGSLAVRALDRGDGPLALQRAERAMALAPGDGLAALTLARLRAAAGDEAGADRILAEARLARPDPVEVDRERVARALAQGRLAQARGALKDLSASLNHRKLPLTEVMLSEGALEETAGNPALALVHYRNAARAAPQEPQAALRAADLARKAGHDDLAVTILKEVSALHPHPAYQEQLNALQAHRRR